MMSLWPGLPAALNACRRHLPRVAAAHCLPRPLATATSGVGVDPSSARHLESELRAVRRSLRRLRAALDSPPRPARPPLTPAAVFVASRARETGFVPGLGSASARPSPGQMYRADHALFRSLGAEQRREYEDVAERNRQEFAAADRRWREAHVGKAEFAELEEAEERERWIKARLKHARKTEKLINAGRFGESSVKKSQ